LEQQGVQIYEETPVIEINERKVKTAHATVTADHIIVCVDRFLPDLGLLEKEIYHAQTFLMVSQVLAPEQLKTIFPEKNYMVWDTEFIYNYYRVTGQGRLLLGGGSVFNTFDKHESYHNQYMYRKLTKYFAKKFPNLSIQFEQFWPGLIGLSKDIGPIAGPDKDKPSIYYISAAAGLPIAVGMGTYAAEHIMQGRTDLDHYLSPYRGYFIGRGLQTILGTKIAFGLSNLKAHYFP
jgi:gamma-glutamylputrescine oxidase